MSIGSWDPETEKSIENHSKNLSLDKELLSHFITKSAESQLSNLADVLNEDEKSLWAGVMNIQWDDWTSAVNELSTANIIHIMQFLTAAEMQLSGWAAEEQSPVIALNKVIKGRGEPLSREQILWIKSHTRNRFLPNGPIVL